MSTITDEYHEAAEAVAGSFTETETIEDAAGVEISETDTAEPEAEPAAAEPAPEELQYAFQRRDITRSATAEEKVKVAMRLVALLEEITQTESEAKETAKDYRKTIAGMKYRQQGLQTNLHDGTITEAVEVREHFDWDNGVVEFFDRDGVKVDGLTRTISREEYDANAKKKQLDLFAGQAEERSEKFKEAMQKVADDFGAVEVTIKADDVEVFHQTYERSDEEQDDDDEIPFTEIDD